MKKIKNQTLNDVLIFIIKLNIFLIPIYIIPTMSTSLYFLQKFIAISVLDILKFFGIKASLSGLLLTIETVSGSFGGFIDFDCTGWKSIVVFLALIFSTPSKLKDKLSGIILSPIFIFANIIRISLVFLSVSIFGPESFSYIHYISWTFLLVLIILLWIEWIKLRKIKVFKISRK
ncbi:MAG: exosortase/archaeosortase family protein [Candidatus Aenigmarchaeota archaeon]|nr:exosortase/archaeosortase family protein [Candidatus Aenigmarchaeota archaeon]